MIATNLPRLSVAVAVLAALPVHAADYVELQSKANVTGDVYYRTLEMHLGAVVQGRLVYQDGSKTDKVVQLKPATAD